MPGIGDIRKLAVRFSRFVATSLLSFAGNILLTAFLHEVVGIAEPVAYGCTLVFMFIVNFLLTVHWIIPQNEIRHSIAAQLVRCVLISISTRSLEWLAFVALMHLTNVNYLVCIAGISVVSFLAKFWAMNRFLAR